MSVSDNRGIKSFTLVELLIVIAILAVLAAAVVLVLNPAELLAQARDSQRISDVNMAKKAVDLFIVDNSTTSLGTANRVYISLPDSSTSCANITGLPTLPATWQYVCAPTASLRNINGTGWLPLDLSQVKGGSPIPYLPLDPQNDPSLTKYYQYIPGTSTFELTALMESEKQAKAAAKDGGTDAGRLEVGSDVSLWRTVSGLVGYWPFEGSGTITNGQIVGLEDVSGNSNNGTARNTNGIGMSFVPGRIGSAVMFDGSDDHIDCGAGNSLRITNNLSISLWYYSTILTGGYQPMLSTSISPYTSGGGWHMIRDDTRTLFRVRKQDDTGYSGSQGVPRTNEWVHLTGIFQAPYAYLYEDGKLIATNNIGYTSIYPNAWNIFIGKSDLSFSWKGYIDDVQIYNRSLKDGEVRAIYNAGK